jgi:hypothetical protein
MNNPIVWAEIFDHAAQIVNIAAKHINDSKSLLQFEFVIASIQ